MYEVYANGYRHDADNLWRAIGGGVRYFAIDGKWEVHIFAKETKQVVIKMSKDPFDGFEATIYPALKDAIIAEQNRLTDEDYQALSIVLDATLTEITDDFADARTVYDFFLNVRNGLGGDDSENFMRLMAIQHKIDSRKN